MTPADLYRQVAPSIASIVVSVAGVIARKATGLTKAFDQLLQSFDQNIQILTASGGGIAISGIDPVKALLASQQQMKMVSLEIKRSSNVGIGYAIWPDALSKEAALNKP